MKEYWNGNKPLWKAFWLIWLLGTIAIPTVISGAIFIVAPFYSVSAVQLSIATYLFLFIFNPYFIYCWVSVWRCSKNTNYGALTYLAKAIVLMHITLFTFNIYSFYANFEPAI